MTELLLPPDRLPRWLENFTTRHGATELETVEGGLGGLAADGSTFHAALPWGRGYRGPAELDSFLSGVLPPERWGVLLVRKGGFAVGLLERDRLLASKFGRRHVQGRTKAGGQSQQRFARRRDNQARDAYQAATEHAVTVLGTDPIPLVVGGDRDALAAVLGDRRIRGYEVSRLAVPGEPRREALERAIGDACSVRMRVKNS